MSGARGREAGELPPEHGARFVLEREHGAPGAARYRVRIESADAASDAPRTASTWADLGEQAEVMLAEWSHAPEPWALEFVIGLCRTLGKNHAAAGDWPRVLRRWRAAPERPR